MGLCQNLSALCSRSRGPLAAREPRVRDRRSFSTLVSAPFSWAGRYALLCGPLTPSQLALDRGLRKRPLAKCDPGMHGESSPPACYRPDRPEVGACARSCPDQQHREARDGKGSQMDRETTLGPQASDGLSSPFVICAHAHPLSSFSSRCFVVVPTRRSWFRLQTLKPNEPRHHQSDPHFTHTLLPRSPMGVG
jgi:hypothetical protein